MAEMISRAKLMKSICLSNTVGNPKLANELNDIYTRYVQMERENGTINSYYEVPPHLINQIDSLVAVYVKQREEHLSF